MSVSKVWLLVPTGRPGQLWQSRVAGEPPPLTDAHVHETLRSLEAQGFRLLVQVRLPARLCKTTCERDNERTTDRMFLIFVGKSGESLLRGQSLTTANLEWRCVFSTMDATDEQKGELGQQNSRPHGKPGLLAKFWSALEDRAESAAATALGEQLTLGSEEPGDDAHQRQTTRRPRSSVQSSLELEWIQEPMDDSAEDLLTSDSEDEDAVVNEARLRLERCSQQCVRFGDPMPLLLSERRNRQASPREQRYCTQCGGMLKFVLQVFVQKCLFLCERLAFANAGLDFPKEVFSTDIESADVFHCEAGCGAAELDLQ